MTAAAPFIAVFTAMIMLIAAYLLRRASRPFDPPRIPLARLADPAPLPGKPGDDTLRMLYGPPPDQWHTALGDWRGELGAMLREGDR